MLDKNGRRIITPGMTQEEHERIVSAGLKMLGVKDESIPDIEQLMRHAKEKIDSIRQYINTVDEEIRAAGREHNRQMLMEEVSKKYLDSFVQFNKDELLMILAMFLAQQTVKEIV